MSFDRGDHWQSLQLNLPTTVVSDMTVHDNDLVISTYGRGFWILDDVSPLRQARAALASTAPAFLFKPSPASRARWDNTQDTPLPPEMVVGENPPEGAILDYYLAAAATGVVTLTISDAAGGVIREYSSVAPPADTTMANVPEYWLAPPAVLPTTAGMHRVAWDLRYPDPPTLNYGYSGNAARLSRVHLELARDSRQDAAHDAGRADGVAGDLHREADGERSDVHAAAQRRAGSARHGGARGAGRAVQAAAADGRGPRRDIPGDDLHPEGSRARSRQAGSAVQAIDAALTPLASGPAGFGIAHRDLGRRLNDMLVADMEPTPSIVAGVDAPCANIDRANEELRKVQAQMASASIAGLPQWTPPAAPACGAK